MAGAGRRPLRVGLLWHSLSSGNLGVGALTLANMAIARAIATEAGFDPRFVVIGMRDADSPPITGEGIEGYVLDRRTLLGRTGFRRLAGELDCVLDIGAGDSFAEIYGAKRFFFLWWTKLLVERRGVPLILSPQTIGPFTRPVYRRLAAYVMRRADAVIARDRPSLEVARRLAGATPTLLSTDVAFELPYRSRAAERAGGEGEGGGARRLRVGINASGLLFHEAETGRNRFGLSIDYATFTRRLIATLQARGDVEVHLVAHATSGGDLTDDDGRRAAALKAEFPDAVLVPVFPGASEAKSYISSLDFLVAGRMHACIGAFSSGTPIVPIAYSRKFSGLFGSLGYDWMVPVTGMDDDAALAFVLDALDRRDDLARDAATGMTQVTGLLDTYREALARLFQRAGAR